MASHSITAQIFTSIFNLHLKTYLQHNRHVNHFKAKFTIIITVGKYVIDAFSLQDSPWKL